MTISRAEVEHVAELGRLGLDAAEVERMQAELSRILDAMEVLKQLDTSAIPPTAQVIPLQTVMREDVSRPSLPFEEALQNAPRIRNQQFLVPLVLEE